MRFSFENSHWKGLYDVLVPNCIEQIIAPDNLTMLDRNTVSSYTLKIDDKFSEDEWKAKHCSYFGGYWFYVK